jgi:hypothetical protein
MENSNRTSMMICCKRSANQRTSRTLGPPNVVRLSSIHAGCDGVCATTPSARRQRWACSDGNFWLSVDHFSSSEVRSAGRAGARRARVASTGDEARFGRVGSFLSPMVECPPWGWNDQPITRQARGTRGRCRHAPWTQSAQWRCASHRFRHGSLGRYTARRARARCWT